MKLTVLGEMIRKKAFEYPVNGDTISYEGTQYHIKCQNIAGSSNLAILCQKKLVDPRNVGWVWVIDNGGRRKWICKYEIKDGEFFIVKPNEELPCEKENK